MALVSPTHGRSVLTSINARIKLFLPDVAVKGFPPLIDKQEVNRLMQYRTICTALQVRSPLVESVGPKAQIASRDSLNVTLSYFNKDLQSHESTVDLCEWTRDILTLFQPTPECTGLQSNGYNYVAFAEGFWVYQQTFTCNRTYARRSPLTEPT